MGRLGVSARVGGMERRGELLPGISTSVMDFFLNLRDMVGVPNPPVIDQWPTCLETSIWFWWGAPSSGSTPTSYTLACAAISFTQDVSGDVLDYTVTGLTAGTSYTFTITANNVMGPSEPAIFPSVAAGLPPSPPSLVSVSTLTSTSIRVAWTPVSRVNQAPLRSYLVYGLPSSGGISSFTQTAYPFMSSIDVGGLSTNTTYQFRLHAFSDPGYSVPGMLTSSITMPGGFLTIFGTANEGQSLTLTTTNGKAFTSTVFASYGTPTGTNGNYTIGGCHAVNSASIVSGLSLGRNSFTVSADNAVFGDPCSGTPKRLYITMLYPV